MTAMAPTVFGKDEESARGKVQICIKPTWERRRLPAVLDPTLGARLCPKDQPQGLVLKQNIWKNVTRNGVELLARNRDPINSLQADPSAMIK